MLDEVMELNRMRWRGPGAPEEMGDKNDPGFARLELSVMYIAQ